MIVNKFFVIAIILILATSISAQDEPSETQRIGDVADSNPFDEAVNHNANSGNKAQLMPVINTTGSAQPTALPSTSYLDEFTPTSVSPNPSVTKYTVVQNSESLNISAISYLVTLAMLFSIINLVN